MVAPESGSLPTTSEHRDVAPAVTLEDLERALARGELQFHFQPRVSLVLGSVIGAEALIRWVRDDGTTIPPAEFIPLAEASGFITRLTAAFFEQLLADLAIIHAVDPLLDVSFNVSAQDFESDDLTARICSVAQSGLVAKGRLEIELTETAVLGSGDAILARLQRLRACGVRLAMDDFGTGFSGLEALSRLPFSTIKLDQGLVRRVGSSDKDTALVEASIRMGHVAGLDIVAEGIEDQATYLQLQGWGCTVGQGYWMSRPLALDAFLDFVRRQPRWPAQPVGLVHMAMLDHIAWRKGIMDLVFYGTVDGERADAALAQRYATEPTDCRLGQWYYGGGQHFASDLAFQAIEGPHRVLHEIGQSLVAAALEGRPHAELIPKFRRLSEQSVRIIDLLQQLEAGLLASLCAPERRSIHDALCFRPPAA